MSVEVMKSVIDAAEGRVPVDTLFTNAQIVDVYGQRVAPGSVAVKDGVIVGVLLGSYIGTMLAFFEKTFGFQLINSQIYFIDYLPSDVNLPDVLTVAGFSLFLALLATLYPSWRAARTRPADALRYE